MDLKTGELIDGVLAWVPSKIRSPYGTRWYMSNQDGAKAFAMDDEYTKNSYRVFMYLMSELDFENYLHIPQVRIAMILGMTPGNVSNAISLLVRKGNLLREPGSKRNTLLRLNPHYGWKGKVKTLKLAINNVDQGLPI